MPSATPPPATMAYIQLATPDYIVTISGVPLVGQFETRIAAENFATPMRASGAEILILETLTRPDPYWITRDGRVWAYCDLSDKHLENIYRGIVDNRWIPQLEQWAALEAEGKRRGWELTSTALLRATEHMRELGPQLTRLQQQERLHHVFGIEIVSVRDRIRPPRAAPAPRTPIRCEQCDEFFAQRGVENVCPSCTERLSGVRGRRALQSATPAPTPAPELPTLPKDVDSAFFVCVPCQRNYCEGCIKRGASSGLVCTCTHDAASERFRRIEID